MTVKEVVINLSILPLIETMPEFKANGVDTELGKDDIVIGEFNGVPVKYFTTVETIDVSEDLIEMTEEAENLVKMVQDKFKNTKLNVCLTKDNVLYLTVSSDELMKLC